MVRVCKLITNVFSMDQLILRVVQSQFCFVYLFLATSKIRQKCVDNIKLQLVNIRLYLLTIPEILSLFIYTRATFNFLLTHIFIPFSFPTNYIFGISIRFLHCQNLTILYFDMPLTLY